VSAVIDREAALRITDKLLAAVAGENAEELQVALGALYCAANQANGYPAGFAMAGIRAALEQPLTDEAIARFREKVTCR
jgi:hypothetical protein